uniref:Sperm-tail PG-rich repeat-containing protein 2-like n=2 Tax=Petromyzon marinus TaxID=7757 RepID=A0AAJ7XCH6_PETMA|nr:sperm-tail PG-rich repeat-containing protein 2-like [Petromyzon marinus]
MEASRVNWPRPGTAGGGARGRVRGGWHGDPESQREGSRDRSTQPQTLSCGFQMHGRAPRVTSLPAGGTAPTLGPGSYDITKGCPSRDPGFAPFLSLTSRDPVTPRDLLSRPGPGHYNLHCAQKWQGRGDGAFGSHSQRFIHQVSDGPGPGQYEVTTQEPDHVTKPVVGAAPHPPRPHAPPSIPCPFQSHGYRESNTARGLEAIAAPETDSSLGPAFYCPQVVEVIRGCAPFARSCSARFSFKAREGPGPGQYEPHRVQVPRPLNVNVVNQVGEGRRVLFVNQQQSLHQVMPRHSPGPGSYDICENLYRSRSSGGTASFLSHTKRFTSRVSSSPSPASYSVITETRAVTAATKSAPFSQSGARFQQSQQQTPGPGSYQLSPSLGTSVVSMATAFGSSAPRPMREQSLSQSHDPGPAHYNVSLLDSGTHNGSCSVFLSKSPRLLTLNQDNPGPGYYDVSEVVRTKKRAPHRTRTSTPLPSSLLYRSPVPREQGTPGPGHYELRPQACPRLTLLVSREDRFTERSTPGPGPGEYECAPLPRSQSFNVTLGAKIPLKMNTRSPGHAIEP